MSTDNPKFIKEVQRVQESHTPIQPPQITVSSHKDEFRTYEIAETSYCGDGQMAVIWELVDMRDGFAVNGCGKTVNLKYFEQEGGVS